MGYRIPFSSPPTLSRVPLPISSYSLGSIKGKELHGEVLSLTERELSGLLQPSFCSLEGIGLGVSNRPFASELVCLANAVPDGD